MWSSFKSTPNTLQFLCLFNTCPEAMVEKILGDCRWIIFFEEPRMLGFILCHGTCVLFWWQHLYVCEVEGSPIGLCTLAASTGHCKSAVLTSVLSTLGCIGFYLAPALCCCSVSKSCPILCNPGTQHASYPLLRTSLSVGSQVIAVKELPVRCCCL